MATMIQDNQMPVASEQRERSNIRKVNMLEQSKR